MDLCDPFKLTSKLEEFHPSTSLRGILPDALVTVVSVQWFGSEALELTYKDPSGRVANQLLYRHDEPRVEVVVKTHDRDVLEEASSWIESALGRATRR